MPRLALLRHADAAWPAPGCGDIDRPLTARGREDLVRLAGWLADNPLPPVSVLCSPALRARQSWDAIRAVVGVDASIVDVLYQGGVDAYLEIAGRAGSAGDVLLVGHNPSCADLVYRLAGGGASPGFPPGALAVLELAARPTAATVGGARLSAWFAPTTDA